MKNQNRNSALFTDLYELTMAQGYWKNNMDSPAVFDMFCRKNPFHGGFSVFAGLETLIEYIENFTFSKEDIEYLRSLDTFEDDFLAYLANFKFSGDIYAMTEGSIVFPNEPIVRVPEALLMDRISLDIQLENEGRALSDLNTLLVLNPDHAEALFFRAYIYAKRHLNGKARIDYDAFIVFRLTARKYNKIMLKIIKSSMLKSSES